MTQINFSQQDMINGLKKLIQLCTEIKAYLETDSQLFAERNFIELTKSNHRKNTCLSEICTVVTQFQQGNTAQNTTLFDQIELMEKSDNRFAKDVKSYKQELKNIIKICSDVIVINGTVVNESLSSLHQLFDTLMNKDKDKELSVIYNDLGQKK